VITLAFAFGLCIAAVGAAGLVVPALLVWIARHFVTSGAFYVLAVVRIAFGLVLIRVAPASRAPRALRVLGYVILVLGVATVVAGAVDVEQARAAIDAWLQLGTVVVRVTALPVLALGAFVAYACGPRRRTT